MHYSYSPFDPESLESVKVGVQEIFEVCRGGHIQR
jgi:hypothetical protein